MEPLTQEKFEALREHVRTLNEQLDDLRLRLDLAEKKKDRLFLEKEIEELVSVLDPLTCELFIAEEAFQRETDQKEKSPRTALWGSFPTKEEMSDFPPSDEVLPFQPPQKKWLGQLIRNEKGDVYRLMHISDEHIHIEKQKFLFDPVRWVSVDGRRLTFGIDSLWRPLTVSEMAFPRLQYKSPQGYQRISPFWIGKTVKNRGTGEICKILSRKNGVYVLQNKRGLAKLVPEHSIDWFLFGGKLRPSWIGKIVKDEKGNLFRVLSKHSDVGAWRISRIDHSSGGFTIERETSYVTDDSTGWSLVEEETRKIDPSWVGKNIEDEQGRVYRVVSHSLGTFTLHGADENEWSRRCIHEDSLGVWKLAKDKGKEKVN
nr:hypothetical protein MarFTME_010 [Marseillevirus futianmevirus]